MEQEKSVVVAVGVRVGVVVAVVVVVVVAVALAASSWGPYRRCRAMATYRHRATMASGPTSYCVLSRPVQQ